MTWFVHFQSKFLISSSTIFSSEKNHLFASYPLEIILLTLASTGQLTCLFSFLSPAKFDMRQAWKRAMLPQWGVFVLLLLDPAAQPLLPLCFWPTPVEPNRRQAACTGSLAGSLQVGD